MSNWEYFQQYPVIFLILYVLIPLCAVGTAVAWITDLIIDRRKLRKSISHQDADKFLKSIGRHDLTGDSHRKRMFELADNQEPQRDFITIYDNKNPLPEKINTENGKNLGWEVEKVKS